MIKSLTNKIKTRSENDRDNNKLKSKFEDYQESEKDSEYNWNVLPNEVLLKIFHFLSHRELSKASQVCHSWNLVGQDPQLWQTIEINIGKIKNATTNGFIRFVLEKHSKNLKSVIFNIDSAVESAEKACQILSKLVDCSLRTLALISSARPVFFDVDQDSFTSALTVVFDQSESLTSLAIDNTPVDDPSLRTLATNHSKTLQLLRIKYCPRVSPAGVLALADNCRRLKELSLSYTLLSDDLILSLSSEEHVRLTQLRIDVYKEPTTHHLNQVSSSTWKGLIRHSPNINLVLYFFIIEEEMYDCFFNSYIPVTHLYFCEYVPCKVLQRISRTCPRLRELVLNGTDTSCIDSELMNIGRECQLLSSIGLSDCFLTCSGFVEFVRICSKRLSELFIGEDCFIQDSSYDLEKVSACVSELLSKEWAPEFTPLW